MCNKRKRIVYSVNLRLQVQIWMLKRKLSTFIYKFMSSIVNRLHKGKSFYLKGEERRINKYLILFQDFKCQIRVYTKVTNINFNVKVNLHIQV